MKVKTIVDETFQDYKKSAMLISACYCDWKCENEDETNICKCHNSELATSENIEIDDKEIVKRYLNNPLTNAIIIAGLEPFLQFEEVLHLIKKFRKKTNDDIIIYTGYYENEISKYIKELKEYKNIIIKFGRFKPNRNKVFDKVLGIELISENQYAKKIS